MSFWWILIFKVWVFRKNMLLKLKKQNNLPFLFGLVHSFGRK